MNAFEQYDLAVESMDQVSKDGAENALLLWQLGYLAGSNALPETLRETYGQAVAVVLKQWLGSGESKELKLISPSIAEHLKELN